MDDHNLDITQPICRWEEHLHQDTEGRIIMRREFDGDPPPFNVVPMFRGRATVTLKLLRGTQRQADIEFSIDASSIDEAFAKFDEICFAEKSKVEAEVCHQMLNPHMHSNGGLVQ